jgi:hypothetical protein
LQTELLLQPIVTGASRDIGVSPGSTLLASMPQRASRDGRHIRFAHAQVEICVSDNGIRMPPRSISQCMQGQAKFAGTLN